MKQHMISQWLKGLVILLGILGILFFGGLSVVAFWLRDSFDLSRTWIFIFYSWYTAILCYGVLFQFWKVCNEIGADNSFSMENAQAFRKMGMLGIAAGVGYVARMLHFIIIGEVYWWSILYPVLLILLSVIFVILCLALSALVKNAYEVKLENELTI